MLIDSKFFTVIVNDTPRIDIITEFHFFSEAMRGKYRISDDRYEEFYAKLVRPKLVDFLSDERKRWRKSNELLDRSKSNDQSNSTINNVSSTETPDAI